MTAATARGVSPPRRDDGLLRRELLSLLSAHEPSNESEGGSLLEIRHWLETVSSPFARSTVEGHVTASAVVLDPSGRALLLLHRALGRWLQPGGHLEPGEAPWEGALRESREETGLADLQLVKAGRGAGGSVGPWVLDVDVHPIPDAPAKGEPAHRHLDVCFLVRTVAPDSAAFREAESRALRWVTQAEMESLHLEPATRRRLLKAFSFARTGGQATGGQATGGQS